MQAKYDYTNGVIDVDGVAGALRDGKDIVAKMPESELDEFLEALKGFELELVPTGASRDDLIANTAAGAALGTGLGLLLRLAGIEAPTVTMAAAGGLIGGAAGYLGTKYTVQVTKCEPSGSGSAPLIRVAIREAK